MFHRHFSSILLGMLLMLALAACGSSSANSTTPVPPRVSPTTTTKPIATATIAVQATRSGQQGTGPIIITSPTMVPGSNGQAQQVVFSDRVLVIENVSHQPGTDAGSTAIGVTLLIKNTSGHTITNQASYFQLLGEEGDTFGLQANAASFFGSIAPNSTRSGTIVFQIPTVAATGLHLFYSPDVATDKALVTLKI